MSAILDEIKRRVGVASWADGVRFALRHWARSEGIDWTKLEAKAKPKRRRKKR